MSVTESELPQAALDMLVLQTVSAGPLHGFDITQRLDLIAGDAFRVPRASIYPTLHRLEGAGLLAGAWQRLAAGRDAKFYRLTRAGRARLKGAAGWALLSDAVGRIAALQDYAALDFYTYMVAGCVGEFWTKISMAHTPALSGWDANAMSEKGVRFGKALQLTNVLRDVPRDLRLGRCYLPENWLSADGLALYDLLQPSQVSAAKPVLYAGIEKALEHFTAAEEYVLTIPGRCLRLRLAALWPVLIGLATLARLARNDGWLDPDRPSRINRGWVYRMMARSWPSAASDTLLKRWIGGLRQKVEASIPARENAPEWGAV